VTSGDFDRDGSADLAFLAEIDYDRQHTAQIEDAKTVWVLYGGDDGWALVADNLPTNVIGDVITSADFNNDGELDIAMASNSVDWRYLVMLNRGGRDWGPSHYQGVLSAAYHFGVAPAGEELFAAFTHFRVMDGKNQARTGLIRYVVTQGDEEWVAGQPVFVDTGRENPYFRVSAGDLDGDGRADLVAGRKGGGLEIWLQDESGEFVLESGPEFDAVGRIFDVHLIDLNGDGMRDVIAAGTAVNDKSGGIYVWLTGPTE
jgi:hypothetical protein